MSDIFNAKCNLVPVVASAQHWKQEKFSYMNKPRPYSGIMLMKKGRIDFATKSETLCAREGDIIFLPEGCFYEARFYVGMGPVEDYLINFTSDGNFSFCTKPTRIMENASSFCEELFDGFIHENRDFKEISFKCKADFYNLMDMISKDRKMQTNPREKMLVTAENLLKQDEEISIRDIARVCAVSESGLRALFKKRFGVSPAKYRLNVKIQKAKFLLESTDMTAGEISEKLGFFDTAYFCKVFRTHTGTTPRQYAQSKNL